MGSIHNKRIFTPYHHSPCTRTHQIGAILLVAATFVLTRLFDQTLSPCNYSSSLDRYHSSPQNLLRISDGGGSLSWPQRGYGSQMSLKIYIYDENEIEGLKLLLYGRDGAISADSCVKGQWGTQVVSENFLNI